MEQALFFAFAKARSFKFDEPVNSVAFDDAGELCVAACDDESIHLYNAVTGAEMNVLLSQKYGVDLIQFVPHDREHVVYASKNGWDHTLRCMNLRSNAYVRYFRGHRDRVVSVAAAQHALVSASLDGTVRRWDARVALHAQSLVRATGRLAVALAPDASVLAVAANDNCVRFYDARRMDGGAFLVARLAPPAAGAAFEWSGATFSARGDALLLSSAFQHEAIVVDAFSGAERARIASDALYSSCVYTADDQFILAGTSRGHVLAFDAASGAQVHKWRSTAATSSPARVIAFNPRRLCFAVGGSESLAFYTPE